MNALMMALPALIGLGGSLAGGLTGDKAKQGSTYTKNQRGLIDDLIQQVKGMQGGAGGDITQNQGYQQGQSWLNSLFNDPEFFKNMEAPAMRQFEEEIVPNLANRFAGMGSGGALGSTAFRNQLGREGSNLATNLAANRTGMQQQGVNQQLGYAQQPFQNMMQLIQQALTPPMNQYHPATPGFGGNIGASMFGGLSQGFGNMMGQGMANYGNPSLS